MILLPLLTSLCCGPEQVAMRTIEPRTMVVIAPTGLDLQSAPRPNAPVIGHLNYLQAITIIAESLDPEVIDGHAARWFLVEKKHGIPAITQKGNPEIWVPGHYLQAPGNLSNLETGYEIEISSEEASRCCYEGRPTYQECMKANPGIDPLACDPGEECAGGGSAVDLEYGWTPTALEWATDYNLQSLVREGKGPPDFRPLPYPCKKQ